MTYLNIIIKNTPVTIDLSKMKGLNADKIYWGEDNTYTTDTYQHTYQNPGRYMLIGNFEDVYEIEDNFTIKNLYYIDITNFTSLNKIGDNFLNNSFITYLNLYSLNIEEIGDGFLDGCDILKAVKLQNSVIPQLGSWGHIDTEYNVKLYTDRKQNEKYRSSISWCPGVSVNINYILLDLDFVYQDNIYEDNICIDTSGSDNVIRDYVDLEKFTNLKNAIDNNVILVEQDIEEIVDEKTRRVYKDDELLKKSIFILQYKLYFKDNPSKSVYDTYELIYTRLVKALNYKKNDDEESTVNKRYLKLIPLSSIQYANLNKIDMISIIVQNKYLISDPIKDISKTIVNEYGTEIMPFQDYNDPPYCRGYIVFGKIDNLNLTNFEYTGDIETGMTIEIRVKGICKNIKIYDADSDLSEKLKRPEWIKINTDKLPEGKLMRGDYITINTTTGEKSAFLERDGEKIDILKYIDRTSSWLTLRKGQNLFYATADEGENNGSIYNVEIILYVNNKYEGV